MKFTHDPNHVVHCRRTKYDIYIGRENSLIDPHDNYIVRPGFFGNPFILGKDGNRPQIIQKYYDWVIHQPEIMKELPKLKGKVLGCWCSPQLCHGDVLRYLLYEMCVDNIIGNI